VCSCVCVCVCMCVCVLCGEHVFYPGVHVWTQSEFPGKLEEILRRCIVGHLS